MMYKKSEVKPEWLTSSIPENPLDIIKDIQTSFVENDFLRFAKYLVFIPESSTQRTNLAWENLFIEQQQFCLNRTGHDIVVKPRRVGFSTLEVARDLFFCLKNESQPVLIVAQENKVAKSMLSIARNFYQNLSEFIEDYLISYKLSPALNPFPTIWSRKQMKNTEKEIKFSNGSILSVMGAGKRKGARGGASMRGLSASRLHLTELAHWENIEGTWAAIDPLIKPETEVVIESTPIAQFDKFHNLYIDAKNKRISFRAHFYKWTEHKEYSLEVPSDYEIKPRNTVETDMVMEHGITKEQLHFFQQKCITFGSVEKTLAEYPLDDKTCFMASALANAGDRFFNEEQIQFIKDRTSKSPIQTQMFGSVPLRIWEHPINGIEYVMGVDIGQGHGGDATAFVILRLDNMQIVAIGHHQYIVQEDWGVPLTDIRTYYNKAWFVAEFPSGAVLHNAVVSCDDSNLYSGNWSSKYNAGTWQSTEHSRMYIQNQLLKTIENKVPLWIPERIAEELCLLYWEDDKKVSALGKTKKGKKPPGSPLDDCAIAYAIALSAGKETIEKVFSNQVPTTKAFILSDFSRRKGLNQSKTIGAIVSSKREQMGLRSNSRDAINDAIREVNSKNKWRTMY